MNKIFKKIVFIILIIFSIHSNGVSEEIKLKIGVLVPMSGNDSELVISKRQGRAGISKRQIRFTRAKKEENSIQ